MSKLSCAKTSFISHFGQFRFNQLEWQFKKTICRRKFLPFRSNNANIKVFILNIQKSKMATLVGTHFMIDLLNILSASFSVDSLSNHVQLRDSHQQANQARDQYHQILLCPSFQISGSFEKVNQKLKSTKKIQKRRKRNSFRSGQEWRNQRIPIVISTSFIYQTRSPSHVQNDILEDKWRDTKAMESQKAYQYVQEGASSTQNKRQKVSNWMRHL